MQSSFKKKPDKVRQIRQKSTIDERHKKVIMKFNKDKKTLASKRNKLEKLKKTLTNIEKGDMSDFAFENIKQRSTLKVEIEKLEDDIYKLENNEDEIEYYSKVDDILMDYYDEIDDSIMLSGEGKSKIDEEKKKELNSTLSTLKKLNNNSSSKVKYSKKKIKKVQKNSNIRALLGCDSYSNSGNSYDGDDYIERKPVDKAKLLDNYIMMVNNEKINKKTLFKKCDMVGCDGERIVIQCDGICVCETCGDAHRIAIENEKPNYKDPVPDKPGYPYKRINHLNEWLSQFQAKESIEIPKEIYDNILSEIHKKKIYDLKTIGIMRMRKILKSLGYVSYYEHSVYIICKLSGKHPPTISKHMEDKIRHMFMQIQEPFEKHKPANRYNFLSYSYVLHKFFELLELDEYLQYFPLLKSREKLRTHDFIWKKMCHELRWEFIPSA